MHWSFSGLQIYEACPLRYKFAKIDKLPELPRAPDNPMERGNRIHDNLERYVKGTAPLNNEAKALDKFVPALDHLKELYTNGMACAEDSWFFDEDWNPCERDNVWLWLKLDFNVEDVVNHRSIIGDYKSGSSRYKTISHVQQMQLYAACVALRQEWADNIEVELWYVDEGHIKPIKYTREQALMYVGRFDARAKKIFDDKYFRANPSRDNCR